MAREAEGEALTLTLDVKWRNHPLRSTTTAFPPGASSSTPGAEVSLYTIADNPPLAEATCSATDSHGLTASRKIDIP